MDEFEQLSDEADSHESDCKLASAASPKASATEQDFFARVERWRDEALRHPDDWQACIGALNAGVALTLHAQQTTIERSIESCQTTLLEQPVLQAVITAQAGLFRQFHSMLNLEARLEEVRLDTEIRNVPQPSHAPPRKAH